MRSTSRVTTTAAGLAVAALVLSGCGAENSASESTDTSSSPTSSETLDPAPSTPSSSSASSSTSSSTSSESSSSSSTQTPTSRPTRTATTAPSTSSSAAASSSSSSSESGNGAADEGKKDDGQQDEGNKDDESAAPGSYSGDTLKMGDSGARVTEAQKRLAQLGYWTTAPDGSYGGGTRQAIYAVQKAAGIKRTGELDAATQKALQSGVTPKARTSNRGLEFDVAKQLLLVVDGGKVVRTINASSGNGEKFTYPVKDANGKVVRQATTHANTPAGSYKIYFERDENWESTLELGSLYRPKYFDGGIAVHGASSVPPYPASHGCVRVTNATMDWLWSSGYANKNAPVTVY